MTARRLRRPAAILVSLSCLLGAGCLPSETDWTRLEPSIPAPEFTLPQLDGDPMRLSDLRGRVVIVEFWATWCAPCRFSTPSLDQVYRRNRDREVSVLLINAGEQADVVRTWVDGRFESPILMDAGQQIAQRYGVRGIPTLFVIDQDGQIVYKKEGYRGGLEHNLKLILSELLEMEPV